VTATGGRGPTFAADITFAAGIAVFAKPQQTGAACSGDLCPLWLRL